jgi:N-acetylmuramoyl-L-alanine amidase
MSQQLEREQEKWKVDCVVIDPGHGGKDPGAVGVTGLKEKEATLDIALRLKQLLAKNTQLRVVLTREDDRFIGLNERTKRANSQAGKLFISIHCNSLKKGSGSGFETYFLKPARNANAMEVALRENSVIDYEETTNGYQELTAENYILLAMAQSEFVRESEGLAAIVQKKMLLNTGLKDRGVDQAGFYVLVGASMPAILVETAFLSSKHEEKLLRTKKFRQQVAQALCESVLEFMKQTEFANRAVSSER